MGLQLLFQVICFMKLWLLLAQVLALETSLAKPGCLDKCGEYSVPYPFGMGADACWDNEWYAMDCNTTTSPPTLFLRRVGLQVVSSISIEEGEATFNVRYPVLYWNCSGRDNRVGPNLEGSPFTFSASRNKFVAAGCNKRSLMTRKDSSIWGCESRCDPSRSEENSCDGINCCNTTIPPNLKVFNVSWSSIAEASSSGVDNGGTECAYAFMVLNGYWFPQILSDPVPEVTAVLEWYYMNDNLLHSYDQTPIDCNSSDYEADLLRCYCKTGYQGNPYLYFPYDGCQDIDECKSKDRNVNPCGKNCVNTIGHYSCRNREKWIIIGVSNGVVFLFLLFGAWWLYMRMKRKEMLFKRNGGLLLQQKLSESGVEKTKLFTSNELETATDNYNENHIVGRGGQGIVYKGMLRDGTIVALKKCKIVNEANVEQFINEVVIVSQINHRNVVKLLGCCLEMEVPMLVYEFVSNGTLHQHIHDPNEEFPLSWEMRLRIAKEIAEALFYMHSAASLPIYHRDIKSTNIFLDNKYKAKVSDFGISRSVADDKTHLTTLVQGTFGYLDPEYFRSSQFTEKSDVYSFGVVMLELLTGEKPVSSTRSEEYRSLVSYFIQSMEENRLFEIIDPRIIKEGKKEGFVVIAQLAKKCLHENGKNRPTMKEVTIELEGIQILQQGLTFQKKCEEVECNTIELTEVWDTTSTSTSSCFDTSKASSYDVRVASTF